MWVRPRGLWSSALTADTRGDPKGRPLHSPTQDTSLPNLHGGSAAEEGWLSRKGSWSELAFLSFTRRSKSKWRSGSCWGLWITALYLSPQSGRSRVSDRAWLPSHLDLALTPIYPLWDLEHNSYSSCTSFEVCRERCSESRPLGTSLAVPWLRLHFPVRRVRGRSLGRELRSHMPPSQKPKNIKQKQYCNKLNEDFEEPTPAYPSVISLATSSCLPWALTY